MITRGRLEKYVLQMLSKTPKARGYFTADRVEMTLEMVLSAVATEMFVGGNGFANKIKYVDVLPNQVAVQIPRDVCYINQVRYLVGNVYNPCTYSEDRDRPLWTNNNAGAQLYPYCYRIVDNCLYFNPAILDGGQNFLMLETTVWPKMPANSSDYFDVAMNPAFFWFMVHACATSCLNQLGQAVSEWASTESYWYDKVKEVIQRRNNQAQRIGDFE